jgi:hypothetical protein
MLFFLVKQKKEDPVNMKLFLKILEGIEYWMFMVLILFCGGAICAFIYQYFGEVYASGVSFRAYIWSEGLYTPILWPFATFSAIGWVFIFHIGAFMKVAAILSAIAIIRDRAELMKEENQNERPS